MSEWICPGCGGGFPDSALLDRCFCPWCETVALGDAGDIADETLEAARYDGGDG